MGTVYVDKLDPQSGTALEIGSSGDTITVPTGAGLTVTDEVKTNKISPSSGTAFTLGDSGDTFTVPAGATIANSGTATGFGMDATPAWYATDLAGASISASTWTIRVCGTEIYDTNSAYNTSTGTFTVPSGEGGKYLVMGSNTYDTAGSGRLLIAIYVGSTAKILKNYAYITPSTPLGSTQQCIGVLNLSASDAVTLKVWQDASTASSPASQGNENWFAGWKLS